jgi:crotonobetainyl-CoA:carnitine CoA-transferase CaiB-like acyl-CoA transferase
MPEPMPKYGQHTWAILEQLGYEQEPIEAMIEGGVAGIEWSEKYLPE